MKQLYSARNGLDAHDVRLFLESRGIEAKVFGDNNALEIGFAFTPASAPGVFVNEADFERATALLKDFRSREDVSIAAGTWACPNCGESVEAQFDTCWNCESPRGDTPIAVAPSTPSPPTEVSTPISTPTREQEPSGSTRPTYLLWIEVALVLAATQAFYIEDILLAKFFPSLDLYWTFATEYWLVTADCCIVSAITLFVICISGEPMSRFGLKRPRMLMDAFEGSAVTLGSLLITFIAEDSYWRLLANYFTPAELFRLMEAATDYLAPESRTDLLVLLVASICIGFCEELVMRGYLIPRLERLLRSTWWSVMISSVLFGSMHWHQGAVGAWSAFVFGICFGTFFVYSRRIWPLVVAHATVDFVIILSYGIRI